MTGQVRTRKGRTNQNRSGWVRTGQNWSGRFRICQDGSGWFKTSQDGSGWVRTGQDSWGLPLQTLFDFVQLTQLCTDSVLVFVVLISTETNWLSQHFKESLQGLQKLLKGTQDPVVYFFGGSLPLHALLNIKSFTLLNMIAQLGFDNICQRIESSILSQVKPKK